MSALNTAGYQSLSATSMGEIILTLWVLHKTLWNIEENTIFSTLIKTMQTYSAILKNVCNRKILCMLMVHPICDSVLRTQH